MKICSVSVCSGAVRHADSTCDTADTINSTCTADSTYTDVAVDNHLSMLPHCVTVSSNPDQPLQTLGVLQRNCLVDTNKLDQIVSPRISSCDHVVSPCVTGSHHIVSPRVSGALLKRSATDEVCNIPHKRATTHSAVLDTSITGMISPRVAGNNSALPTVPMSTLPSFPPTLFSCFPSLGNTRAQCPPRVPQVISSSHTSQSRQSTTTATSTLFSIPVHGVARGTRPLLLVPSLQNCVLIPSACTMPLVCVLNPALQLHNTSAPTTAAVAVGIPQVAHNSQPNISLPSHMLRPVGAAISVDQSVTRTTSGNPNIACDSLPLRVSLPNIRTLSQVQRPVVGATGSGQLSAPTSTAAGITHTASSLQPLSVPGIPLLSYPLWPVAGASAPNQSCLPPATGVGISHIARNSLPTGLSMPNIPIVSHLLRPVGGATIPVDQSAVRLVSGIGRLRVPPLPLFCSTNTSIVTPPPPRLNGIISPRTNALLVPGIFRPSQSATMPRSNNPILPMLPKPLCIPYLTLPRSSLADLKTQSLPLTCTSSVSGQRVAVVGHMSSVSGVSHDCLDQKSAECRASSTAGSLLPIISPPAGSLLPVSSTQSILRTILNERITAMAAANMRLSMSSLTASEAVNSLSALHASVALSSHVNVSSGHVSASVTELNVSSSQHNSAVSSSVCVSLSTDNAVSQQSTQLNSN